MATKQNGEAPMVRLNLYVTAQQNHRLEALKKETGLPAAELIRRALDFYVPFAKRLGVHEVEN